MKIRLVLTRKAGKPWQDRCQRQTGIDDGGGVGVGVGVVSNSDGVGANNDRKSDLL